MNGGHIVALLTIIQFVFFGVLAGQARGKYGVTAPAMVVNEHFERAVPEQISTLEQLVCFVYTVLIAAGLVGAVTRATA